MATHARKVTKITAIILFYEVINGSGPSTVHTIVIIKEYIFY